MGGEKGHGKEESDLSSDLSLATSQLGSFAELHFPSPQNEYTASGDATFLTSQVGLTSP